jgi:hypothetical protein
MDIKKEIELIAIKKIPGFDPKEHMDYNLRSGILLYSGGKFYSYSFFDFLLEVKKECDVFIPKYVQGKLRSVSDVVVAVENLKRVKVVEDAWVPCAWDGTRQCWFMSNGRKTLRSNISPNTDFCNAVSCGWHCAWEKMAKIK